eukprot:5699890-Amphidinium_carterae.1
MMRVAACCHCLCAFGRTHSFPEVPGVSPVGDSISREETKPLSVTVHVGPVLSVLASKCSILIHLLSKTDLPNAGNSQILKTGLPASANTSTLILQYLKNPINPPL